MTLSPLKRQDFKLSSSKCTALSAVNTLHCLPAIIMSLSAFRPLATYDFASIVSDLNPLEPFNETAFTPKAYSVSSTVERYHHVWRFGHTNNFTYFVNGLINERDSADDYVAGVISASIMVFAMLMVWLSVILLFKFMGQKRVSFLAGRLEQPLQTSKFDEGTSGVATSSRGGISPIIDESADEIAKESVPLLDENYEPTSVTSSVLALSNHIENDIVKASLEKSFHRKVMTVRIVFILSGIATIIAWWMYYAKGVTSLNNALMNVRVAIHDSQDKTFQAINTTDIILTDQKVLEEEYNSITSRLPSKDGECGSIPIVKDVISDFEDYSTQINEYSEQLDDQLTSVNDALRSLLTLTENADQTVASAEKYLRILVGFSIPFIMTVVAMLITSLFIAKREWNCFTRAITSVWLWPVYILLLILSLTFATIFLISSLAGADFCVQPDQIVTTFLMDNEDKLSSDIYPNLINYVTGCTLGQPLIYNGGNITGEIEKLHNIALDLQKITQQLSNPLIQPFLLRCGLNETDVRDFQNGADHLHNFSHLLNNGINSIEKNIFSCPSINPIYTMIVHDALCVDAEEGGFIWLFSTTLAVSVFSLMMITLRSAMYPIKTQSEVYTNDNELRLDEQAVFG